jgi:hypothetical protein
VEQNTENMKTGVIGGAEYRKHKKLVPSVCFSYSAPPMAPVFMFSMLCSTDGTSFCVFGTLLHRWHQFSSENMKTGVSSGTEYQKHENWCHHWSRVPKT